MEPTASRTALGVAALRAAHQLLDDRPPLLDDPLAVRLLGDGAADSVRAEADRYRAPGVVALRAHVVLRSRFAEDCLAEARAHGVAQYVLLGAGYDTSPYRLPPGAPLRVFEVDHAASQEAKRERVAAAGIAVSPTHAWVAADLARGDLDAALRAAGFDAQAPAFVACLGVLMYLDAPAADAVLRFAARLPAPSECVFSFAAPAVPGAPDRLAELAAAGEPWRCRVTPDALASRLDALGFRGVALVGGAALEARYDLAGRRDGLADRREPRLARARV